MRRLAWLTVMATARAAPDTDTLLARAAALARWANRTGPAPAASGDPIGKGPPEYGTAPTELSDAFRRRAEAQPLQLARSLLACFRS